MGWMDGFNMTMGRKQYALDEQKTELALKQFAEQQEEKQKNLATASKAAEYFFKANPQALQSLGLTDQQFANMSAAEQIGAADGYYKAQATKQVLQQFAQQQQQMDADTQFATALKSRTSGTMNIPAAGAPGIFPGMTAGTRRPPTRDDLLAALAEAPLSRPARELMSARLLENGAAGSPTIAFNEDPETGTRFATYGNVLQPSGVNPNRAGKAVTITGPNGESLGVGLPNKGGVTPLNTGAVKDKDKYARLTRQLTGLIASQGKAAEKYGPAAQLGVEAYQKQIDAVLGQIQELEQGDAPAAGGASVPASQPAKRYKLVNGKLVAQ